MPNKRLSDKSNVSTPEDISLKDNLINQRKAPSQKSVVSREKP